MGIYFFFFSQPHFLFFHFLDHWKWTKKHHYGTNMLRSPIIIFDTAELALPASHCVNGAFCQNTAMTDEPTMEAWFVSPEECNMPGRHPAVNICTVSSHIARIHPSRLLIFPAAAATVKHTFLLKRGTQFWTISPCCFKHYFHVLWCWTLHLSPPYLFLMDTRSSSRSTKHRQSSAVLPVPHASIHKTKRSADSWWSSFQSLLVQLTQVCFLSSG